MYLLVPVISSLFIFFFFFFFFLEGGRRLGSGVWKGDRGMCRSQEEDRCMNDLPFYILFTFNSFSVISRLWDGRVLLKGCMTGILALRL